MNKSNRFSEIRDTSLRYFVRVSTYIKQLRRVTAAYSTSRLLKNLRESVDCPSSCKARSKLKLSKRDKYETLALECSAVAESEQFHVSLSSSYDDRINIIDL